MRFIQRSQPPGFKCDHVKCPADRRGILRAARCGTNSLAPIPPPPGRGRRAPSGGGTLHSPGKREPGSHALVSGRRSVVRAMAHLGSKAAWVKSPSPFLPFFLSLLKTRPF